MALLSRIKALFIYQGKLACSLRGFVKHCCTIEARTADLSVSAIIQ
jgi:hypothetical protein